MVGDRLVKGWRGLQDLYVFGLYIQVKESLAVGKGVNSTPHQRRHLNLGVSLAIVMHTSLPWILAQK